MLRPLAEYVTYALIGLDRGSPIGDALEFFVYDTIKIFLLLSVIIFIVSVIRSFFPPERTRAILSRKRESAGNVLAALLGVVTPFCSCSAVPLFIGFVEAGIPLGVTLSFLISSPMVNEVAVVLLWGLFGWKIAAVYAGTGLLVAVVGGLAVGKLKLERWVEDYVYQFHGSSSEEMSTQTFRDRLEYAKLNTADILKRVWLYIIVAIPSEGSFTAMYRRISLHGTRDRRILSPFPWRSRSACPSTPTPRV